MFSKDIDRNIEGVIKVGTNSEEEVIQELEEYVVTSELQKHFATFFSSYAHSGVAPTTKIGAWISGFFGSGKSHFLKILSYLLENKAVQGRHAIDFFTQDGKITDANILRDIAATEDIKGDVILFNVDSKNQHGSSSDNRELLNVFVNVFNARRGYSASMPYLADIEEELDAEGKFDAFKKSFAKIKGASWEDTREKFKFNKNKVVDALVDAKIWDKAKAEEIVNNSQKEYSISIEEFAKKVTKYCDKHGDNYHVAFLVDEVGQYIGGDNRLMLNLQTLVEEFSKFGKGRIWVIVTSQQNIDEVLNNVGGLADDFSKIQGRFDTRLTLASSDVDEVLKRRILEKTDSAAKELKKIYKEKENIIKNLLIFTNDTPYQKVYSGAEDFSESYPFVPYQFALLQASLNDIRRNSASGRSISSGARSMISMMQETAWSKSENGRGNEEVGTFIPFDAFYDPMHNFIDHIHQQVIFRAGENKHLEAFDLRVLKALFLVKYVKNFKANIDNLTTLLVDNISCDRIELRKKVISSLNRLENEVLVQKNIDVYSFLTDQEQEVNRSIQNENVSLEDIRNRVAQEIFDGIIKSAAYKYSNRYTFKYDRYVDNAPYGQARNTLAINVLTPYASAQSTGEYTEETLAAQSMGDSQKVIIKLSDNEQFLKDIATVIKIERFVRKGNLDGNSVYGSILAVKTAESKELENHIRDYLEKAVAEASIYVNGSKQSGVTASEPTTKINAAMRVLVENIYNKLDLLNGFSATEDIIHEELNKKGGVQLFINADIIAKPAMDDMSNYLQQMQNRGQNIVLKDIVDRYQAVPYGYIDEDIYYLLAMLFKGGKINLKLNGEILSTVDIEGNTIYQYLTQSRYKEKLGVEPRLASQPRYIAATKQIRTDCFEKPTTSTEEDQIFKDTRQDLESIKNWMENNIYNHFRGDSKYAPYYQSKAIVDDYKNLIDGALSQSVPNNFFKYFFDKQDDFRELAEDYKPIRDFFDTEEPQQYELFNHACDCYSKYMDCAGLLVGSDVEKIALKIADIINMKVPYGKIQELKDLREQFNDAYLAVLNANSAPILSAVEAANKAVDNYLDLVQITGKEQLEDKFYKDFAKLKNDVENTQSLEELIKIKVYCTVVRDKCIEEIKAKEESEKKKSGEEPTTLKPCMKTKSIEMASLKASESITLKTEADVDKFVGEIHKKLSEEVKAGNIIMVI